MQTSPSGRAAIEQEEGTILFPYKDQAGKLTIGTGHLILPGEDYHAGITQAQADALLANDLRVAEGCVNAICMSMPGQNAFDACVSLAFNIGTNAFIMSTVVKCINGGDYLAAADAFLLWNKASVGGQLVVLPVLAARRARERARFLLDVATLPAA